MIFLKCIPKGGQKCKTFGGEFLWQKGKNSETSRKSSNCPLYRICVNVISDTVRLLVNTITPITEYLSN